MQRQAHVDRNRLLTRTEFAMSPAVSLLNVRHYFANLDAFESDRLRNHLRHLIRRSPSSVL